MNRLPTQLALISAYSNTLKGLKLSMDKDPFHRMDVDPSTVIQQLTFPVLRKLSIIVRRNTHQVVASLLRRCPALEHAVIELDHTYKSDGILSSMTADYLPRIEQLDLVAQKDMEVGCDELTLILESHHRRAFNNPISTGVPQSFLRKVSLSCFTISSSSDLLVLLASLPKMEAIVLSDLTVSKETMDDFANTLITASESSSSTTSLKQLSLIRLQDALTDDTIGVFCSIPTLKSLELQRIFRITDKCAQHFVKAASHLERLVVQRCPLISVDSLNQAKESGVKHVVFSSMLLRRRTGQTTLLICVVTESKRQINK
ncbi:hypothetical protein BDA99DRAFT_183790 [Phascolomyces articulosus]|uniref:Uncharacterized protein n=1 Tax=Phascolomyces articulosus TaxID=60185 RepID=A0AAD5PBP2_9FUNG|nr:hypothetical protein BDA99DRAFT_183790 [Phascolomyces articulosus]